MSDGITFCFAGQSRRMYWAMLLKVVLPGLLWGRKFEVHGTMGGDPPAPVEFTVPVDGGDC